MNKIINSRLLLALMLAAIISVSGNSLLFSGLKVYPKLITPGTPTTNENVFFDFDDFNEPKPELRIFDLTGRLIRSIQVLNPEAISSGWRLVWDGKDGNGNIVFPGVYIYQWREGFAVTSGAIVVAR